MLTRRRRYHPLYDGSGAASRCGGVLLPQPRPLELALAAEGLSNPQIGERLYISRRTVQTHVAHIFMKLGISSRAQLAAEVIRQPWRG